MNMYVILCIVMSASAGWIVGGEAAKKNIDYTVIFCGAVIMITAAYLTGVVSGL